MLVLVDTTVVVTGVKRQEQALLIRNVTSAVGFEVQAVTTTSAIGVGFARFWNLSPCVKVAFAHMVEVDVLIAVVIICGSGVAVAEVQEVMVIVSTVVVM